MNKALPVKVAVIAAALIGAGLWLASGHDLKALAEEALQALRTGGPVVFFLAMALLPALGVPILFFSLTAGPLFAPLLGMPMTIALSLIAIALNMVLGYLLAHRVLRPLLERVVQRLGYRLPQAGATDATDLIVLLRVTPGIPFAVQHYLLGLANAPLARYLFLSCLIALPLNTAIILCGEAIMSGRGGMALTGILLALAAIAAIRLLRKHYRGGKGPSADPLND